MQMARALGLGFGCARSHAQDVAPCHQADKLARLPVENRNTTDATRGHAVSQRADKLIGIAEQKGLIIASVLKMRSGAAGPDRTSAIGRFAAPLSDYMSVPRRLRNERKAGLDGR